MSLTKRLKDRIDAINVLFKQYDQMTIRQIYYRLVGTMGVNYRQVIYACKIGREQGLVAWESIVDRARPSYDIGRTFETAKDFLASVVDYFNLDYWTGSDSHIEIWTEKDALSQILYKISGEYQVPVRVTRGFLSISNKHLWSGDKMVLYFGDFDPSGLYIDEDLKWECSVDGFTRIALTKNQIEEHTLPSVAVNRRDPRARSYMKEHGSRGWELDALPPDVLQGLVRQTIEKQIDFDLAEKQKEERRIRLEIERVMN